MSCVFAVANLKPYTRSFILGIVISLLLLRLLWIFEHRLILHLFGGYELDRALVLHKTERTLFQILFQCQKKSTERVYATVKEEIETASTMNLELRKEIEKYSKLKTFDAITAEIVTVQKQLAHNQMALSCLENMIFAYAQDSSVQSRISSTPQNRHNHNENFDEIHEDGEQGRAMVTGKGGEDKVV